MVRLYKQLGQPGWSEYRLAAHQGLKPLKNRACHSQCKVKCSRVFSCSVNSAKRSFYRSANAMFGEVGIIASEEKVLQLIKSKCIPVFGGMPHSERHQIVSLCCKPIVREIISNV